MGLNFFQATVNISLAPFSSNPIEILEGRCLKVAEEESSDLFCSKEVINCGSPDTSYLPASVNSAVQKKCGEQTQGVIPGIPPAIPTNQMV